VTSLEQSANTEDARNSGFALLMGMVRAEMHLSATAEVEQWAARRRPLSV
jgi:hypothetical protein